MISHPGSATGHAPLRRNAIWPWLVMPLIVLALFAVLHNVRRDGGGSEPDSAADAGIP